MSNINTTFCPANILFPKTNIDLTRWSVIACDQYTSDPLYWEDVEDSVGDCPSTLRLILPEVYLETKDRTNAISEINQCMSEYLSNGYLTELPQSIIWIERKLSTADTRYGLLLNVDLEQYDFSPDSSAAIRATEETIISRIPPRVEIRKDAPIELPHIVLLYHDSNFKLKSFVQSNLDSFSKLYNFNLMQSAGSIKGYQLESTPLQTKILDLLHSLSVYDTKNNSDLLGVMGDGNHSLASAKAHWDVVKATLSESEKETHPARFALVELVNLYDDSMEFEPIHRVLFNVNTNQLLDALKSSYSDISIDEINPSLIDSFIKEPQTPDYLSAIFVYQNTYLKVSIKNSNFSTATAVFQDFIDQFINKNNTITIDYIHGETNTIALSEDKANLGIILPAISKDSFFTAILNDGPFPRKTFSIGHADDKRFYLESRKIK